MSDRPVIELARDRAERPDQERIGDICDELLGQRYGGEISAVAVVSLLNGGQVHSDAYAGLTRQQKMALVGALEELKARILAE
ncbi:hypothetical protein [uncultured Ruegeria sp.]|uniref:hypothetical protein n=1 Tax=uncultured Ruegeria sp. TaxID=259304 RepID=UPI002629FB19|nr:hypothetical protein [uncultured Ruegeria sp.]